MRKRKNDNKGYRVYKLYNPDTQDTALEFFLPDNNLERVGVLACYAERGYKVLSALNVDRETYLKLRLESAVEEYIYQDEYEQEVKYKYAHGEMKFLVYRDTMKMIEDYKKACLRRIILSVRRILNSDFEVHSEIAIQLYDMYGNSFR